MGDPVTYGKNGKWGSTDGLLSRADKAVAATYHHCFGDRLSCAWHCVCGWTEQIAWSFQSLLLDQGISGHSNPCCLTQRQQWSFESLLLEAKEAVV